MSQSEYQRGCSAAYQEFIDVFRSSDEPHGCGGTCNACLVIQAFVDHAFTRIEACMSEEDHQEFLNILERANDLPSPRPTVAPSRVLASPSWLPHLPYVNDQIPSNCQTETVPWSQVRPCWASDLSRVAS